MRKTIVSTVILIIVASICSFIIIADPPSLSTLSQYGSKGEEVRKIQTKLKQWGYYNGNVDGIYGWRTQDAVKKFQKKNGLTVDGIAGTRTLAAIGISGASASAGNSNDSSIDLLARVINGEARGEPYEGQVAVGAVVLNRVKHPSFPNTISGVVYQPGAFTAVSDGQINAQMYESSRKAARDAMNGWDPAAGAIYYYNPQTASNQWIRSRPVAKSIGKHLFCH